MKRLITPAIKQFQRMLNDDGRDDKVFGHQEYKLKEAVARLKNATEEVIRASSTLSDLLMSADAKKIH